MINVGLLKISNLSKLTGQTVPSISKIFKEYDEHKVTRVNKRIIGIAPNTVESYLSNNGCSYFYRPAVILSANLCGGVGKTTSIYNLGACMRRLSGTDTPIVYVDGDSQGSFTSIVFGEPADDKDPILIDFLENKVKIDDILTNLGNNIWFVKSNLNQVWIDKVISKPQTIKKAMLRFYTEIFNKLGPKTKIFQDHAPQLSSVFASSICALHQLPMDMLRAVLIPIRSDKFAIQGADYILKEIEELQDTFTTQHKIDIHCFFSSIDRRVSTTSEALKATKTKESIVQNLSSVVVRYCSEVPKSIMRCSNVYAQGKNNNAAQDYQDLLQYVCSFKG